MSAGERNITQGGNASICLQYPMKVHSAHLEETCFGKEESNNPTKGVVSGCHSTALSPVFHG
jgi:hypothetical protein